MRATSPLPAMGTVRSRGSDSTVAASSPGSMRTIMIVSLRLPVTSEASPAEPPSRTSLPTTR